MSNASDSSVTPEVKEGERKYRALFEQSAVGVAQIDSHSGRFLLINQFYCELVGYTREEMLERDFQSITHPDDLQEDLDKMDRVRAGMLRTFQMDKRYLGKGGAQVWVHLTVVPLWAPGERPDCHLAIVENITDRKRAEDALRYSEERWRIAAGLVGLGTWDFYPATGEIRVDPKLREMVWMTADEPITIASLEQRVVPEERELAVQGLERCPDAGKPLHTFELQVHGPAGESRHLVCCSCAFFEGGRPVRVLGATFDITEHKRAEEALRVSAERFRTMANAIPQHAWIAGPTGYLYWYNQRWYEYTGTTPAEIEGWGWQSVIDPVALPKVLERWQRSLATVEPFDMVVPLRGADGVYRSFLIRSLPFKNAKGRVIQWFGTNTDITERVEAEDELRSSRQRMEDADRDKCEFLAMLSHELRNPLEPIRNSLFILDRAAPGGEQARHAQRVIERQVGQLARLVGDLLDVTRISCGKVRLQLEPLDLADVVRRAVDDHGEELSKHDIDLQLSIPAERIPVVGDRERITQVMGNLLSNAAKFTQRGGRVLIAVEVDRRRRQAVARVRDTGLGIEREMLTRIFEMFTQGESTLERTRGGLGLGLALVKAIVEMHGGKVTAESEGPGTGATFTVCFPLVDFETRAEPGRAARPSAPPRRVLVIEDNVDSAETLRDALELDENTVDVAFSGAEGIEHARAFHPEVVLCDIGLPGMDGYQVARAMRAEPALKSVALVALTGFAAPEDIERSRLAGFDAVVAKPASVETLERILREPPWPMRSVNG